MHIVHADQVFRVEPGTKPDYRHGNPLVKLMGLVEAVDLAEERDFYLHDSLQYLFPFQSLTLYGPSGGNADVLSPEQQDDKGDFQKQNVKDFRAGDLQLVRGGATVGEEWTGPFLKLSYRGGPDSELARLTGNTLGDVLQVFLKVGAAAGQTLRAPYNPRTHRYELEVWGYAGNDLPQRLGDKGRAAMAGGALLARAELAHGSPADFARDAVEDAPLPQVAPDSTLHPVLPLHVECAWADADGKVWDSRGGANYHYEFDMLVRGWDHYLRVGRSEDPHGGVGTLEYRTLLSNYAFAQRGELGRTLPPWSADAFGRKGEGTRRENFFAVDYMDLHLLRGESGIGLHRHRDNQEVFLMLQGRGYMVVGDWAERPERQRAFEVRVLREGHLAMLRGGQLHALMNPMDEDVALFMFGGYD